ncbi:hypothetical protein NECAME_10008 [Necator americanus]|uniref:Uncharacterized protein n=1 Tax=Necator americanus TaxID=51031 RepID=W2TBZ3_NECAM|nr:hypothetical protein NECAME_10008 [Necator americanus]ETN79119.1 hypothetical protein NECAME_10008 [Necator americanus]
MNASNSNPSPNICYSTPPPPPTITTLCTDVGGMHAFMMQLSSVVVFIDGFAVSVQIPEPTGAELVKLGLLEQCQHNL